MTFGELKTLVSGWFDDLNYGYFTESIVETYLNNAQNEVQKRLLKAGENYYTRCVITTTNAVQNYQTDYALPEDFREIQRLELITQGLDSTSELAYTIAPMTLNQRDLVPATRSGVPYAYFIKKNKIVVTPAPDAQYTIRLFYAYKIADMVEDTDTPDVPSEYHELIALLAAETGFMRDDRVPSLIAKKIEDFKTLMDQDAKRRHVDQPRRVRVTQSTGNFTYGY